jgi:hypothetical protein
MKRLILALVMVVMVSPAHAELWWQDSIGKFTGFSDTSGGLWVLNTETGQIRYCKAKDRLSRVPPCLIMKTDIREELDPAGILSPKEIKAKLKENYDLRE